MGNSCSAETVGERPYMEPTTAPKTPITKVTVKPKTPTSDSSSSEEDQQVVHRVVSSAFEHVVSHQNEEEK